MLIKDLDAPKKEHVLTKKKKSNINDYIETNNINLKPYVKNQVSDCISDDYACITLNLYKFVKNNFIVKKEVDLKSIQDPRTTLKSREGSIVDLNILYASLLVHAGVPTYIKGDKKNIYTYACKIEPYDMYKKIKEDLRKTPLSEKELVLKNKQVWAVDLRRNSTDSLIVDIEFFSRYPMDVIMFPNKTELNAHLKGMYGRNIDNCLIKNQIEGKLTCSAPSTGIIMFQSLEDNNKFKAGVYTSGILPGDIKFEKSNQKNKCIQVNLNLESKFMYPGL